ncbi:uncharacterized protein BJ171DRAFT_608665 [Polychytrium aggregatum]|uniref:uncharacterized protein n=1 Tax=Polychytrium aggregatum TaxID=110093 RepID=UPI0022FE0E01|nr:uncharacterized protein BJ171DRAFT_608665 [Polychytrium aggregatum]KAI9209541.1 hypothetical protein BJ171DRAFT_608665 [Polychytrium aggregatum]
MDAKPPSYPNLPRLAVLSASDDSENGISADPGESTSAQDVSKSTENVGTSHAESCDASYSESHEEYKDELKKSASSTKVKSHVNRAFGGTKQGNESIFSLADELSKKSSEDRRRSSALSSMAGKINTTPKIGRIISINPPTPEASLTVNLDMPDLPVVSRHSNFITRHFGFTVWLANAFLSVVVPLLRGPSGGFKDNTVRTSRYTPLTFVPKQLYAQFSKVANMYFLLVCGLQMVPGWSPTGRFTTIFPLGLTVLLSMAREGYDDYCRHISDNTENNGIVTKLEAAKGSSPPRFEWGQELRKNITVGTIVRIDEHEVLPVDLVVLASSHPEGIAFVETANLDGETNLKQKQALSSTCNAITSLESLSGFQGYIHAQPPKEDLYSFDGYLEDSSGGRYPLTVNQLLLRGSTLKNTKYVYGIAVYTGEDTKIRKNATSSSRTKAPALERLTNGIVIFVFLAVVLLSGACTIFYVGWNAVVDTWQEHHWYLCYLGAACTDVNVESGQASIYVAQKYAASSLASTFFSFVILYNTMIPISLYVTMELVKLAQVFFINHDINMYDENSDTPAQAMTSTLNEDLGQVQYIFSDKTGTLTENIMLFKKMSLGGIRWVHSYGGTMDPQDAHEDCLSTKLLLQDLFTSNTSQQTMKNAILRRAEDFLEAMALCHTAIPDQKSAADAKNWVNSFETGGDDGWEPPSRSESDLKISYQSSSPDEVALVNAARDLFFSLRSKTSSKVTLNVLNSPTDIEYMVLTTIEFTSARKRMSTIYKYPDGRIVLLCKGADSVIIPRLVPIDLIPSDEIGVMKSTLEHVGQFAKEGLRTLVYACKILTPEDFEDWHKSYVLASTSLDQRAKFMDEVADTIEQDLILLGATAIEDKLQTGVPQTIGKMRRAGIRLWMLTGDKKETAVNIAYNCGLVSNDSKVLLIDGNNDVEIDHSISYAHQVCVDLHRAVAKNVDKHRSKSTISDKTKAEHLVMVIDGDALNKIERQHACWEICENTGSKLRNLEENFDSSLRNIQIRHISLLHRLAEVGIMCDNGICCRFSPSQKALMVGVVKKALQEQKESYMVSSPLKRDLYGSSVVVYQFLKKWIRRFKLSSHPSGVTLAIGDGANDIPMIQTAHVGIGITGKEGLAAARASDYTIAQFRFLEHLLLVHGRYSYNRICLFTVGTFYKCITFYATQGVFQLWTGWSGTSLYEQWTLALFNILFSSLPVIAIGIFEKDLSQATLLKVPELYRYGAENQGLNMIIFWRWMLQAFFHALVSLSIPMILYCGAYYKLEVTDSTLTLATYLRSDLSGHSQEASLYVIGTLIYQIVVVIITFKISYIESHTWNIFTHFAAWASIAVWFIYEFVYPEVWPHLFDLGIDEAGMQYGLGPAFLPFIATTVLSVIFAILFNDVIARAWTWVIPRTNKFLFDVVGARKTRATGDVSKETGEVPYFWTPSNAPPSMWLESTMIELWQVWEGENLEWPTPRVETAPTESAKDKWNTLTKSRPHVAPHPNE